MSDESKCQADHGDDVTVTGNAAEFHLHNGISMLGIFHVRCDCQPTAVLSAPINLKMMTAVCRFCGTVYEVEELAVKATIHENFNGAPVTPGGSGRAN